MISRKGIEIQTAQSPQGGRGGDPLGSRNWGDRFLIAKSFCLHRLNHICQKIDMSDALKGPTHEKRIINILFISFGGVLGPGTIKIFFAMSKNPRMQIMSSFGSGRAQFLIFLRRGSGGVTRSVNIFRVDIKTLKMIFWSCFWASGLSKYWSSCHGASFGPVTIWFRSLWVEILSFYWKANMARSKVVLKS